MEKPGPAFVEPAREEDRLPAEVLRKLRPLEDRQHRAPRAPGRRDAPSVWGRGEEGVEGLPRLVAHAFHEGAGRSLSHGHQVADHLVREARGRVGEDQGPAEGARRHSHEGEVPEPQAAVGDKEVSGEGCGARRRVREAVRVPLAHAVILTGRKARSADKIAEVGMTTWRKDPLQDPPFPVLFAALLLLFLLGALAGVAAYGDMGRLLDPEWWRRVPRGPNLAIRPELSAHLVYALTEIAPRNALIVLAAGLVVPRLGVVLLGDPWPARAYVLATAFAGGLMATPGGLPHGGAYFVVILPTVLLEYAAYALAGAEGVRAVREKRPPRLFAPLLLVLVGALVETETIAWLL